jgi:hypothetical protein
MMEQAIKNGELPDAIIQQVTQVYQEIDQVIDADGTLSDKQRADARQWTKRALGIEEAYLKALEGVRPSERLLGHELAPGGERYWVGH